MEPAKDPDKKPKSEEGFEKLFEELRIVLSDLTPTEKKEPTPLEVHDAPAFQMEDDHESERLGEAAFQSAQSEPVSSDADFWNGNVLGWPDSFKNDKSPEETPEPDAEPTMEEPTLADPFGATESPAQPAAPFPPPSLADSWLMRGVPAKAEPPPVPVPPVPPQMPTLNDVPPAFRTDPMSAFEDPPIQPVTEADINLAPPVPPRDSHDFFASKPEIRSVGKPGNIPPPPLPPSPVEDDEVDFAESNIPLSSLEVSVPGTLEQKTNAPAFHPQSPVTPKSLGNALQIACVYPEGSEEKTQQFLSNLRVNGSKAGKPIVVLPISSEAWTTDAIDVPMWQKRAAAAGADILYVIVSKKDKDLVAPSIAASRSGIKTRLVFLEYLAMKTLYADILAEATKKA